MPQLISPRRHVGGHLDSAALFAFFNPDDGAGAASGTGYGRLAQTIWPDCRSLEIGPVAEIALAAAGRVRVRLPAVAEGLLLVSASCAMGDDRRLGALIARISVDGAPLDLTDERLGSGFYSAEIHGQSMVRWTDGAAMLALGHASADRLVVIDVAAIAVFEQPTR